MEPTLKMFRSKFTIYSTEKGKNANRSPALVQPLLNFYILKLLYVKTTLKQTFASSTLDNVMNLNYEV